MTGLSELGEASRGLWTRKQALAVLPASAIDGFVRRGEWQATWRGVYADAGQALDAEQRAIAAVLAAGGEIGADLDQPAVACLPPWRAAAVGRTAARFWMLPLIDDDDPATGACEHLLDEVAVRRHVAARHHGGRTLRARELTLAAHDVVRLDSGLWISRPLRTLVDCADLLTHEALVCALDAALHRELVTTQDLQAAEEARKGDRSAPAFRAAVRCADGRAESPLETLARLVLRPVVPTLVPQVELYDGTGRVLARFDLADEGVRLAVEGDGKKGHAGDEMVTKDRRRDRVSGARGWWTERASWYDVRRRQRELQWRVASKHAELSRSRRAA